MHAIFVYKGLHKHADSLKLITTLCKTMECYSNKY